MTGAAWTNRRALLVGTVAVGVLDLADAFIFFGLRGATPMRILHSIAAGLVGPRAFSGGAATAVLGAGLHFFIAGCIVAVFLFASRRLHFLTRAPVRWGLIYGIAVYAVMNLVVLPLAGVAPVAIPLAVFLNGILIHMFGVGLPASLVAAAVRPAAAARRSAPRSIPAANKE